MQRKPSPPTDAQFETAIMWLQSNEGDGNEAAACRAVANWIERWRNNEMLREVARQGGVSVAELRRRMAGRLTETADETEN